MILIVGATGSLGGEICRRLRERGCAVRGLVREDSPKEQKLTDLGVEIALGDLKRPETLKPACVGVETVVSTASATISRRAGDDLRTVDRDGQLALVRTAREAGVRRFVYVSVSPNLTADSALVRYKREVEQAVRESGMSWTVLQPSAFMEIWFSPLVGWDIAGGRVKLIGPGTAPASFISLGDVAAFAVLAATDIRLAARDVPLGGPAALSALDAVKIFEEASGRCFEVSHMPVWPLRVASRLIAPFSPLTAALMRLSIGSAGGDPIDMGPIVSEFGVGLTSVRDFAGRAGNPEVAIREQR